MKRPRVPTTLAPPVLVVDDDAGIRAAVRDVLELERIPVTEASDGRAALAQVEDRPPRLVLLDMRMPGLDGWGFARALRTLPTPPPVVIMAASVDSARWAEEIDAAGVITKPFAVADLLRAVERYSL